MRRENGFNEKEMINMLRNCPLTMSEESEQKLQAAYDKILAQCETKRGKSNARRKRPLRRLAVISLAAVMLVGTGIAATAAMGYFSKNVTEENGEIIYEFSLDYNLQPVEVSAVPLYLPDGMESGDDGKLFHAGDESKSISIMPYTMLNIDMMKSQMNFPAADQVEHTTIHNMEADILTAKDDQKYQSSKNILLFNPDNGYIIRVWGDYGVPLEELKKVAENLDITVTENNSLTYVKDDELLQKELAALQGDELDFKNFIENGVQAKEITALGTERDCPYAGTTFRIDNVDIYDSLYDIPGYTEKGVYSMEALTPWLNEDGTHKPYLRSLLDENNSVTKEESVRPKFMSVDITASRYGGDEADDIALDACLVLMEQQKDGIYHWTKYSYEPVPSEGYYLQMDKRCFYLNQPENLKGDARLHSFFYRNLAVGDTMKYTIVFAVDEDLLTDAGTELFLQFNASGGDAFTTDYCALK